MPYINIKDKNIYYREYGEGDALIFLNGVAMGTNSWTPFIKTVSKDYKMVAIDLLDQGKSDSYEEYYNIDTQVEILKDFIDKMGFEKIHLLGMSYGGNVAQAFAIKYENSLKSLILSNASSRVTNIMRDIAEGWVYAASTLDSSVFSNIVLPYMYSCDYYEKNYEDMKYKERIFSKILDEEWYQRFRRNLISVEGFDVSNRLRDIKLPTLIISSEFDKITPIQYQKLMHEGIKNSRWVIMENIGHASMYEKPKEFISIVMEFLKVIKPS